MTPLQAIRKKCLECMNDQPSLIRDCHQSDCILHPYRMGRIEEGADRRLLRVIRSFCLEYAGSKSEVRNCAHGDAYLGLFSCPLFDFRMGRRPRIKESGELMRENEKTAMTPGF